MRTTSFLIAALLAAGACTTVDTKARVADTSRRPADSGSAVASADMIATTTGLQTPESVRYDSTLDVYFVSNIKGGPATKDDDANIVVVDAQTHAIKGALVASKRNGVELNAPKGLAIVGDTLWVADIDVARAFNKRTGALIATVDLSSLGATFLNDVCVGPDNAIYITDSGDVGSKPFGQVIRIAGRSASVIAKGDALENPNGITYDAAHHRFIVVPLGGSDVMSIPENGGAPSRLASGTGQFDGVELLGDGRVLVTSWADSSVYVMRDSSMTRLYGGLQSPADIGVDTKRHVLAVPQLELNQVEYFRLP